MLGGSGSGSELEPVSTNNEPVSPNTFGPQSTLVILMNFSDNSAQPYTTGFAESVTFTEVNNFDLENSYGQTSLTGIVQRLVQRRRE